ncbi:DUF4124 domain-containing protein [Sedimenticola selenatireducens]|uniref:DUF4124 domain-containing protein n=1 Tax=Sedimenticola selenatireducens TaxID=191960 RepID=A0A557S4Q2_9GAMM|nr:DUF4124 domain-containing protein [Sedimenticola selenatireducens]TVO72394.1 DUF4124 domain-containing protein [Sedimenticola selenatireducens]TVT64649.1 MAG: DUF4124 domain-containing protein [Sedimenticola selenatireducens]
MSFTRGRECPAGYYLKRTIAHLITLSLLTLFPLAGTSAVYRCPDAEGAVLFQQLPCSEGSEIKLDIGATEWVNAPASSSPRSKKSKSKKKRDTATTQRKLAQAHKKQEQACWKARQRIEKIEWDLRKGYKPSRGERLRQQRRQQEDYLRQFCR